MKVESKPPRPALIVSEHTVSYYSLLLEHLLVGLADDSIPVALVCPPHCKVDSIVSGAVEVIRHPAFELPLMRRQNRRVLVEQLSRFGATCLHCLCQSKASLTRQLAGQLGLPYVLTVNSLQRRAARFSISLKRCAKIIVPAKSIAANIAQICPNFARRIEQINMGTFVEENSSCFSKPGRLPSMLIAHPLDRVSDFENLLVAVRHLVIDRYEFVLVIVGSGRAESQLRKLLAVLGLSQIVTIVPRLQPWRSVLAAGDIFIQPRPSADFNPLLLEAMSVGMAVAACKGKVDDLIIEGKTAIVFDPDDEISIMGSLKWLLDRPEAARQLVSWAQQYLRENYTVSNMVSSTVQTYRYAQQWLKH